MKLLFSKQAAKDFAKIKTQKALLKKVAVLLGILENNPLQNPPSFEKLAGDLKGAYSRRINQQHRLVYRIEGDEVWIISLWTHYENV